MEKSLEDILHDFGSRYWMIKERHNNRKEEEIKLELNNLIKHTTDELNKFYLKVKKLFKGLDFPDTLIEQMLDFKEVTLDEFTKAISSKIYNGKRVIAAIETENFGYFKTDDNQLYRC